jgi:peptidoglycan/LPS O-acetylase OafA/YrhL
VAERCAGRASLAVGPLLGVLSLGLLGVCAIAPQLPSATAQSWLWGAGFTGLIAWSILSQDPGARLFRSVLRPLRFTAKFSYSLYLIRAPVIALLHAAYAGGRLPIESGALRFVIDVAVPLAAALGLYALVERRFDGRVYRLNPSYPFLQAAARPARPG